MEPAEQSEGRTPTSIRKWISVAVLVLLASIVTLPWTGSYVQYLTERARSLDVLAAATTRDDLESAVGRLGVLLDLPDGEWIAIRYRDSHSLFDYSVAIALTSDGQWFESAFHHCGLFIIYRSIKDKLQEAHDFDGPEIAKQLEEESFRDGALKRLRRIETECTLPEAIDELRALHFRDLPR